MSIAPKLQDYLARHRVAYELVAHRHTMSSMETAAAAHVPGDRLAKGVVVEDEQGYLLAVVPSTYHVKLGDLGKQLNRRSLRLASEEELKNLFSDCETGAVPPVGGAYGLPAVVEEDLTREPDVFFEAGDHEHLVHVAQADFARLLGDAPRVHFARHV
ncbi:MAG: aminoacyl-tRNA deacylase [Pseudomonadota bacterium]|jgi:Ala-tRNA(Pro) deacylase